MRGGLRAIGQRAINVFASSLQRVLIVADAYGVPNIGWPRRGKSTVEVTSNNAASVGRPMPGPDADRRYPHSGFYPDSAARFPIRPGIDAAETALYARFSQSLTGRESGMKILHDDGPLGGVSFNSIHCPFAAPKAQEKEPPMLSIKA